MNKMECNNKQTVAYKLTQTGKQLGYRLENWGMGFDFL
jgi:hypothetical protein